MSILDQLVRLSSAEEFFALLDVPFEQTTLNVHRLHVLNRFRALLREAAPLPDLEAAEREACRDCLTRAYGAFADSQAAAPKTFKVFGASKPAGFIPVSAITRPGQSRQALSDSRQLGPAIGMSCGSQGCKS